jgi:hypothetical protein
MLVPQPSWAVQEKIHREVEKWEHCLEANAANACDTHNDPKGSPARDGGDWERSERLRDNGGMVAAHIHHHAEGGPGLIFIHRRSPPTKTPGENSYPGENRNIVSALSLKTACRPAHSIISAHQILGVETKHAVRARREV